MKKIVKAFSLFLALLMVSAALFGCRKEEKPTETEDTGSEVVTETSETQTEMITNEWGEQAFENPIPDEVNYNGLQVDILVRDSERYFREFMKDDHSQSLDAQIYTRNMKIQKELGVKLMLNKGPNLVGGGANLVTFNSMIETSILSSDGSIDLVAHYGLYGVAHGIRSYFCDLTDEDFTYLNLERPYWNQSYQKAARLNSGLYYAVGDANLSVFDRLIVIRYNETLGEEYQLPDLYQMVLDGDWTYDELLKIVRDSASYEDKDESGTKTRNDLYGIASCYHSEATDPFLSAWDLPMLLENDGIYSWNISGNEKLQTATERLKTLYHLPTAFLADGNYTSEMFQAGNVLFDLDILYRTDAIAAGYSEMEDKMGLLPLPKYDEDQDFYQSGAQSAYNTMCVPDTDGVNREAISAVLEALNYESYNSVRPYYFMHIVRARYVENSVSVKMFDLILNSVHFDVAQVFDNQFWKSTTDATGSPIYAFRNACIDSTDGAIAKYADTMSNFWASNSTLLTNSLNDFQYFANKNG